jgi:hypothetical protein
VGVLTAVGAIIVRRLDRHGGFQLLLAEGGENGMSDTCKNCEPVVTIGQLGNCFVRRLQGGNELRSDGGHSDKVAA